jgi:hypothetical protein
VSNFRNLTGEILFLAPKKEAFQRSCTFQSDINALCTDIEFDGERMTVFRPASPDEIRKIVMKALLKSCERKTVIRSPSNSISVHKALMSLMLSRFDVHRLPLIVSVSSLPFISKILENVVSTRLEEHINSHIVYRIIYNQHTDRVI